jgi:tartrate dehydrogenase/decarboxylase/D-malate dehydrogenase
MMLDHLGVPEAHDAIMAAVHEVLDSGEVATADLGGTATTAEVTKAIIDVITKNPQEGRK